MLCAAVRLLKEMEDSLSGTVLLIFQPAEEALAGAKHIVESGALDGVTAVHGLHVWPGLQSGVFASRVSVIFLLPAIQRYTLSLRQSGGSAFSTMSGCVHPVLGSAG